MTILLGIDLGTTSVKIVLVDAETNAIKYEASKATEAVISQPDIHRNEQNPVTIVETVQDLMRNASSVQNLSEVGYIGVSGQMHGAVLWTDGAWNYTNRDDETLHINPENVSNLITWQDSRCSPAFLSTLPKPDSHLGVHTGFGIPTIFWLHKNEPEVLQKYSYAATIHDFLVSVLTNSRGTPVMSPQNAASWGYFNSSKRDWNREILFQEKFPVKLLPAIQEAGQCAGQLSHPWHGISPGCPIGVALGDLQASIYSTLFDKPPNTSGIMNISTSLQIAFVMPSGFEPTISPLDDTFTKGINYLPYIDGTYVAVAAALTGGNCLATVVHFFRTTLRQFGYQVDEDRIWRTLLAQGELVESTDLEIMPTYQGERSDPGKRASVHNIHPGNFNLGHLSRALCHGIMVNSEVLMPQDFLLQHGIHTLYGTGSALQRNQLLQQELRSVFNQMKCKIVQGGDSALGAALLGKTMGMAIPFQYHIPSSNGSHG